ncbi:MULTISPECIES: hypothetical protein [Comamonas]|uniref:Transposase n=1 Tax=Comamonas avium TaxID=2762231 RepID=A0ABR8SF77_9BURK|nr:MULTISPECIES: hypothetical protein [Comamonas]MBD7962120.1 hypothetical protein [Comamonas avium]
MALLEQAIKNRLGGRFDWLGKSTLIKLGKRLLQAFDKPPHIIWRHIDPHS